MQSDIIFFFNFCLGAKVRLKLHLEIFSFDFEKIAEPPKFNYAFKQQFC